MVADDSPQEEGARDGLKAVNLNEWNDKCETTRDPSPDECDNWNGNPEDGPCGCEARHWFLVNCGSTTYVAARCRLHATSLCLGQFASVVEIVRTQWDAAQAMIQVDLA